uniref:Uncharacterized protein n=1 Tax=Oryza glumipatula TaxID=40148 RepID=A0A0E0B8D7_9ORYZ
MDLRMRLINPPPGGRFLQAPPQAVRMEPTDPLVQKNDFCSSGSCIHRFWWWSLQLLRRWGSYPAATTTLSTAAQCVLVVGGLLLARATVRQEPRERPPRLPSGSGRRQLRLSSNVPAGNQLRRRQLPREDRARHYVWGHGDYSARLLGGGAIAISDVFLVGGLVKDASNRHRAIHRLAKPS